MSQYEITFLLEKEEDQKELEGLLKANSANILQQDKWGKRTLSYPIKKLKDAFYFNWKFEIPRDKLKEVKQKLNFKDNIIRYLLLITK